MIIRRTIALTIWIFVSKVMSLLFNTLSRFVIVFLQRTNCLLISWPQSQSTVFLEPMKRQSVTASTFSLSICLLYYLETKKLSLGDDRGWDGWMASMTRWTWVWVNSRSRWWTGRPGMLRFMGSQRVWHDWVTDLIWSESCQTLYDTCRIP